MNAVQDRLVWDAHAGFELNTVADLETLAVWKAAGVDFLSVNVGYDVVPWTATVTALALARDWVRRTDGYRLIGRAGELIQARAAGEMAIAFDIEGMAALDGRIEMVRLYHDLGVRQMLFAYNLNNQAGGGCHDEDSGLTDFGRRVVAEMNVVGMLVDCSHTGYRTTMEAMELSTAPVVFSHSNARALRDHERNIHDEQALACAATGGGGGVNGIGLFVGENDTSTTGIVDHIDHYLDLIGPGHVGIGLDYFDESEAASDFNATVAANAHYWPPTQYPERAIRCAAPRQFAEIEVEMATRGHDEATIRAVLGGNFARVAEVVWG